MSQQYYPLPETYYHQEEVPPPIPEEGNGNQQHYPIGQQSTMMKNDYLNSLTHSYQPYGNQPSQPQYYSTQVNPSQFQGQEMRQPPIISQPQIMNQPPIQVHPTNEGDQPVAQAIDLTNVRKKQNCTQTCMKIYIGCFMVVFFIILFFVIGNMIYIMSSF